MGLKVVYVSGPFRGKNAYEIRQNVRAAEAVALAIWKAGMVAICPHLNTANFQEVLPDDRWIQGDLEILRRCDAIRMVRGWTRSKGALKELALAEGLGLPVLYTHADMIAWSEA